jgi:hypothetical protein
MHTASLSKNTHSLYYCTLLFLGSRILLYYLAYLVNLYAHLGLSFGNLLLHWDSSWYLSVAMHGYDTHAGAEGYANYPFFPLYPLLIRIFSSCTYIPAAITGQLLANGFLFLSLILFYRLLKYYYDDQAARYGTLLLAISPFNIYFASIYTESLFLLLSLGVWLAALHKEWLVAGLLGLLLSATRTTGFLILLPLIWFVITDYQTHKKFNKAYLWTLLTPLGLLAFMAYLHYHTGDALAFIHIQNVFARPGWHMHDLYGQVREQAHRQKYNLWFGIFTLLLIVKLYYANFKKEALFLLLIIAAGIESGSLNSLARYAGIEFPFYLALVSLSKRSVYLQTTILIITANFLGIFLLGWMTNLYYFS